MSYPPAEKVSLASFADVLIEIPAHWLDITDTLPEGTPPTLAVENGIGALQFSVGLYASGPAPKMNRKSLERFLYHLEDARGVERQMNARDWGNAFVFGITCDYTLKDSFVRVWYCSNGPNVALVTFFTHPITTPSLYAELLEADAIACSLRFK